MIHDFDSVSGIFGKKSECFFAGVEPTTFRLLLRMLKQLAVGDSWEPGHDP